MIDFTNKCVITESDVESAKLLKMAISQGFALPKGEKVMESCRFFRFIGSPYSCILNIHPDIANDQFVREKLSECVDYIRDNYDMEIFTKI